MVYVEQYRLYLSRLLYYWAQVVLDILSLTKNKSLLVIYSFVCHPNILDVLHLSRLYVTLGADFSTIL